MHQAWNLGQNPGRGEGEDSQHADQGHSVGTHWGAQVHTQCLVSVYFLPLKASYYIHVQITWAGPGVCRMPVRLFLGVAGIGVCGLQNTGQPSTGS